MTLSPIEVKRIKKVQVCIGVDLYQLTKEQETNLLDELHSIEGVSAETKSVKEGLLVTIFNHNTGNNLSQSEQLISKKIKELVKTLNSQRIPSKALVP